MGCGIQIFLMTIISFFTFWLLSFHGFFQSLLDEVSVNAAAKPGPHDGVMVVGRIRDLFELRRRIPYFHTTSPSPSTGRGIFLSPSPAPAPAPAQAMHAHHHSHFPIHKRQRSQHDNSREAGARGADIETKLVAALVPAGVVLLLAWVLGMVWFFRKFRGRRSKIVLLCGKKGNRRNRSNCTTGRSSGGNKVTFKPDIDLFYLNSLGIDLEQQTSCLKHDCTPIPRGNQAKFVEDTPRTERIRAESGDFSCSSTREILPVHEDAESLKYDSDSGQSYSADEFIAKKHDASEDESYHSAGDSNSKSCRFSDALEYDINEVPEVECQSMSNPQTLQPSTSSPLPPPTPPPPPPPPPPALRPSPAPLRLNFSSSRTTPKPPSFATLRNSTSSQNSEESRVPMPPSPPQLQKEKVDSIKTPPPPPSQFPHFAATAKDGGAGLPKLKPLHWDKVKAAPDRTMVWDKLRSSSFELDEEMIESLFGYNLQNAMKNDEARSKTPSPGKHVLEPKRLQNITILSKAINASSDQVCSALFQGNGLSQQQLEALVKMAPTKEEQAKLNSYNGDINELGLVEKFVKAVLGIPFAFERAEAMLFKETFEDEIVHLRNSFSTLEEACRELRSSRLFLKLLEAVLKTGNRMNVGTIRGGAKAFKLDALLKLADVKGADGKTTLLHFVAQEIVRSEGIGVSDSIMGRIDQRSKTRTPEEKEEDYRRMGLDLVSGLSTELYNVKKTATIDLDVLASSVSNLSEGMTRLQALVHKDLSADERSGKFVHSMGSFLSYSWRRLKELQEDEGRVLLHVRGITEYFHGDVSKEEVNPLRIFVIVRDFLGMLDQVCKELRCFRVPGGPSPLAPFR